MNAFTTTSETEILSPGATSSNDSIGKQDYKLKMMKDKIEGLEDEIQELRDANQREVMCL